MADLAILIISLAALVLGTRLVVDNAIIVAHHYQLSDFFIGISLLSFGSNLPELFISIDASIKNILTEQQTADLILGNIIGSCFGQIGLIMGIIGMLGYLTMPKHYVYQHGGVLLVSLLALILVGLDGQIQRWEAAVLLAGFGVYVFSLLAQEGFREKIRVKTHVSMYRSWGLLLAGLLIISIGADYTVSSSLNLAVTWGVSQSVIAIVIIGAGSSIPELSISITAMMRSRSSMSVGNLIGSNIFDTLALAGIAGLISPMQFETNLVKFDIPALFILTVLILVFFLRKRGLQHFEAITILVFYSVYIILKLWFA